MTRGWSDEKSPLVCLRRLDRLARKATDNHSCFDLTAAEAGFLLITPFGYEIVLIASEASLREVGDPLQPDLVGAKEGSGSTLWNTWYTSFQNSPWRSRIDHLGRQGKSDAVLDLRAWMLAQFLHEFGEIWADIQSGIRRPPRWLDDRLAASLETGFLPEVAEDPRVRELFYRSRLVCLGSLMFADVDAIVTSFDIRQMAQWASGEGETEWRVDLVKLAHLLSIAGQMALDLRRLPRIIAEHIGSEPQLSPKSVRDVLSKAHGRTMGGTCLEAGMP